jgi:hypothetical protein
MAIGVQRNNEGKPAKCAWPLNRGFNGPWGIACPYQNYADVRLFLPDFGPSFLQLGSFLFWQ